MACLGGVAPCTGLSTPISIEDLGIELTYNGNFKLWTAGVPDYFSLWSNDVNNYIVGDVSTQKVQLVSDNSTPLELRNDYNFGGFVAGDTLRFQIDITDYIEGDVRLAVYDVTNTAVIFGWSIMGWTSVGTYTLEFVVPAGCTRIYIQWRVSNLGATNLTIDNWSLRVVGTKNTYVCTAFLPINPALLTIDLDLIDASADQILLSWTGGQDFVKFLLYDNLTNELNDAIRVPFDSAMPLALGVGLIPGQIYTLHYRTETATEATEWITIAAMFTGTLITLFIDGKDYIVDGTTPDYIGE